MEARRGLTMIPDRMPLEMWLAYKRIAANAAARRARRSLGLLSERERREAAYKRKMKQLNKSKSNNSDKE